MRPRACGQRKVLLAPLALTALALAACGEGPARDFILSRDLIIEGAFQPAGAVQGYLFTEAGERVPLAGLELAGSHYSFSMPADAIRRDGLTTPLDQLVTLGDTAPQAPRGRLANATIGSLAFELAPAALAPGALPAYARVLAAVPRGAALAAEKTISLDVPSLTTAAAVAVHVVDGAGVALPGARVFSVALSLADPAGPKPLRPWDAGAFRPVASRTDANGDALVYPVPAATSGYAYQLVADLPGYCVATTMPAAFDPAVLAPVALALTECEPAPPAVVPAFDVRIAAATPVRVEAGVATALVHDDLPVELELRVKNLALSGLAVRVYSGVEAKGQALDEKLYAVIPPHLTVTVPQFLANASPDGRFAIGLSPILAGLADPPVTTVLGIRNSIKPLARATRFLVESAAGAANVIGTANATAFKVTFLDCDGTQDFGIQLGATAATAAGAQFVRCKPEGNEFDPAAFSLANVVGIKSMAFFLRDAYGNTSAAPTDDANKQLVLIDAFAPEIAANAPLLGVDFGFAPADAPAGTDAAPYAFPSLRLAPDAPAAVLRFARPGACRTEAASGQIAPDERDLTLGQVLVVAPDGSTRAGACAADFPVEATDFDFPANPADDAHITLRIVDLAGNTSAALAYAIPACKAGVAGACWGR